MPIRGYREEDDPLKGKTQAEYFQEALAKRFEEESMQIWAQEDFRKREEQLAAGVHQFEDIPPAYRRSMTPAQAATMGQTWEVLRHLESQPQSIPGNVWRTASGSETPIQGRESLYAWAAGERGLTAPFVDLALERALGSGFAEAPLAQQQQLIERFSAARAGGQPIHGRYGDVSPYTAQQSTVPAHQILARGRSFGNIYDVGEQEMATSQRAAPMDILSTIPGMVRGAEGQYVMGATIGEHKIGKSMALGRQQYQVFGHGPGVGEPMMARISAEGTGIPEWVQRVESTFVALNKVTPEGQGGYDPQDISGFGRYLSKTIEIDENTQMMLQAGQVINPRQGPVRAYEGHAGFDISPEDYSRLQVLNVGQYTLPGPGGAERRYANIQFYGEAGETPAMKAYGTKQQEVAMPGLRQQLGASHLISETRDIFRLGAGVASVATPEEQRAIWGREFDPNQRYNLEMAEQFQQWAAGQVEERWMGPQLYSLEDPSVQAKMEAGQLEKRRAPRGMGRTPSGYMWGREKVIGLQVPMAAQWTGGWSTKSEQMNIETSELTARAHPELMAAYQAIGQEKYQAPAEMFKAYATNLGGQGLIESVGIQDIMGQGMRIQAMTQERLEAAGITQGARGYRTEYQREMLRSIGEVFPGKGISLEAGAVSGVLPTPSASLAYTGNLQQGSYLSDINRAAANLIESQIAQAGGLTRIFGTEGEEIDVSKLSPEMLEKRAAAWQEQTLKAALYGQEAVTTEGGDVIQPERQGLKQIVESGQWRGRAMGTPTSGATIGRPTSASFALPPNRWAAGSGILAESLMYRGFGPEEATGIASDIAAGRIEGPRVLMERNPMLTEQQAEMVLSYMPETEFAKLGLGTTEQYREAYGKTVGVAPLAGQAGGGDFDWDTYLKRMATMYERGRGGNVQVTHLAQASTAAEVRQAAMEHGASEVQSYIEKVGKAPRSVEEARALISGARLEMSPEQLAAATRGVQESKSQSGSIYNLTFRDIQQLLPQQDPMLKSVRAELGALDLTAIDVTGQSEELRQMFAMAHSANLASGGAATGSGGGMLFNTQLGLLTAATQNIMQIPELSAEARAAMLFNPAASYEGKSPEEAQAAFQQVLAGVQGGRLSDVIGAIEPFTGGTMAGWTAAMPMPGNIVGRAALRASAEAGEVKATRSGTGGRLYRETPETAAMAAQAQRMKNLRTALGAHTEMDPGQALQAMLTSKQPGHVEQARHFMQQAGIPVEQQEQFLASLGQAPAVEPAPTASQAAAGGVLSFDQPFQAMEEGEIEQAEAAAGASRTWGSGGRRGGPPSGTPPTTAAIPPDEEDPLAGFSMEDVPEVPFGGQPQPQVPAAVAPTGPAAMPPVSANQQMLMNIAGGMLSGMPVTVGTQVGTPEGQKGVMAGVTQGDKFWMKTISAVTPHQVQRMTEAKERYAVWQQNVLPKLQAGQELSKADIALTREISNIAGEYKGFSQSLGVSSLGGPGVPANINPMLHAEATELSQYFEAAGIEPLAQLGMEQIERQDFASKAQAVMEQGQLSPRARAFFGQATAEQLQGVTANTIEQEAGWWSVGGRENVTGLMQSLERAGITTPQGWRAGGKSASEAMRLFKGNVRALGESGVDVSQFSSFIEQAGAAEHAQAKEDAIEALNVRAGTAGQSLELFTKRVQESSEKLDGLSGTLNDILEVAGERDLTKGEARTVRAAGRMVSQLRGGAAAGEEFGMPAGTAAMARHIATQYGERLSDIERAQVERAEGQEAFTETLGGQVLTGAAGLYRGLTSGWTMMQMRRLWGMTGGQAMGAIPVAGQAEQSAYMAASVGVPMGQTGYSPMAQQIATTQAQQRNAQIQMGRAAYGGWGWAQNLAGNRDLATLGGLALPGLGIGAMAGSLAAAGGGSSIAAGLGGAMGLTGSTGIAAGSAAIALPVALGLTAFATGQYVSQAQSDQERMAIASATGPRGRGLEGWLDYQASQWDLRGQSPTGISAAYKQGFQPTTREDRVSYGERLMQGNLALFGEEETSARVAATRYQVEEATKKGGALEAFDQAAVSQMAGQWMTYTGEQDVNKLLNDKRFRIAMERGVDLSNLGQQASQWGLGPQGMEQMLDQMLSVSQAQAPQLEYTANQWSGLQRFGIEGMDIRNMVYGGQLGQQNAMGQMNMQRMLGGSQYFWSQIGQQTGQDQWVTANAQTGMGVGTNWGGDILAGRLGQTGAAGQNITVSGGDITFNVTGQSIGFNEWDIQDYSIAQGRQHEDWQTQFRQQGMDIQASYVTGTTGPFAGRGQWQLEDESRALSRARQWEEFAFQTEGRQLSDRQFREQWQMNWEQIGQQEEWWQEDFGTQNQRRQTQFGWQLEDLAFRGAQSTLQFGWQMEDLAESERFATGRDRRRIQTQRERATIQYGMGMGQLETQEERIRTRMGWGEEDQAKEEERHDQRLEWQREEMEMRLRHHDEDMDLAQRRQDAAEEYFQAQNELQDKQTEVSREYWELQQERQQEQFDKEKEYKELVREVQDAQLALGRAQQLQMAEWRAAWESGGVMRKAFTDFLSYITAEIGKAQSSRDGLYLPDSTVQQRTGTYGVIGGR